MILKKIEIKGFKSFADRTKFEIGTGITCFAGPNGCGKSNLVDALRWALGEQKVSSLRGESMADVVFKGNASRPVAPYAEVTLIFQNDRHQSKAVITAMSTGAPSLGNGNGNGNGNEPSTNGGEPAHENGNGSSASSEAELRDPKNRISGEDLETESTSSGEEAPTEEAALSDSEDLAANTEDLTDSTNRVSQHLEGDEKAAEEQSTEDQVTEEKAGENDQNGASELAQRQIGERQLAEVVRVALEYPEVAVTRKLHRSGESEYLLNGTQCRLKDIREVFVDTGIGVSAYSFMAQGRIDAILSANPAERRSLFEEAAGVSRYRQRRKEALRKLERVEQDLLRAGDVISELERQSRSLKNQAGRARNYKLYSDRLKEIGRDFYLHSYQELIDARSEIETQKEEALTLENDSRALLLECQEEIRNAEQEASQAAEDASELRTELAELGARIQAAHARLQDLVDRRMELEERLDQYDSQKQELEESIQAKIELSKSLESDSEAMSQDLEGLAQSLQEARSEEEATAKKIEALEEQASHWQRERDELESRRESVRTECVDLRTSDRHLLGARRRQVVRHHEIAESIATVRAECATIRHRIHDLGQDRASLESQQEQRQQRLDDIDEHIGHLGAEVDELKSQRMAMESRHEALGGWIENLEGVDEGVKVLLAAAEAKEPGCPRIRGLVAHYVGASLTYAKALEMALGSLAQAVVVDDVADAIQALEFLKQRKVGRVTIVPLSRYLDLTRPHQGFGEDRLLNHVRFAPELWPLFEALLGDVTVVRDTRAFDQTISDARLVSLEGDLRDRDGTLVGGGSPGAAGLIRRRSELEALEGDIEALDKKIDELEGKANQASTERQEVLAQREVLDQKLQSIRDQLDNSERKRRSQLDRLSVQRQDLVLGLRDLHTGDEERGTRLVRIHSLEVSLGKADEEDASLLSSLESTARERQMAAEAKEACIDKRRELDLNKTRVDERLRALREQAALNEKSRQSSQMDLERLEEQVHEVRRRLGDVHQEREETEARHEEMGQKQSEVTTELDAATRLAQSWREKLEGVRKLEAEHREAVDQSSEKVRSTLMREERHQIQVDRLRERVAEDFDFDLDEAVIDYEENPEMDWPEIESEIKDLKSKISRLGPVNIDAIEELDQVEERLVFMTTQRDDLGHARRTLNAMIADMDAQSRTLFADTFKEVRENFREIFRRLFTGGHADIFLNESDDSVDAGVDIVAAPPGKKAQNIALLSGGERTMTAVALLFSLFKAKPSPICVLDEVDAALDEANIERFCRILDDFEKESQFLIVTHAKRTMARGQVLYGITMEGNGVSKPMAVRLGEFASQN